MVSEKLAIAKGFIYCKAPEAVVTYEQVFTVEEFIHLCLANEWAHGKIVNHMKQLINLMSSKSFAYVEQLEIDYDLIEVSGGMCSHIPSLTFIPVDEDLTGVRSPRAFAAYDHRQRPSAHHFEQTLINSFPDLQTRVRLC